MNNDKFMIAGVVGTLLFAAAAALAQDAVSTQPDNNKVLLENDRVRVIEVSFGPDTPLKTHSHPAHVIYVVEGGQAKFTTADGKVTELALKPGMARWSDAVTHAVETPAPLRAIVVELKQ